MITLIAAVVAVAALTGCGGVAASTTNISPDGVPGNSPEVAAAVTIPSAVGADDARTAPPSPPETAAPTAGLTDPPENVPTEPPTDAPTGAPNDPSYASDPKPSDAFWFESNGRVIEMGMDAEDIFARLGRLGSEDIFVSTSCAFVGEDKIFYYDGFIINTFPLDGRDYVLSITLEDEALKTPEGVGLGDTFDEMTAVYGTEYEEELIRYIYRKGGTRLEFLVEDGVIADVTYMNSHAESLMIPQL